ncbi:MAG: hypothetical protein SGCHY_002721 [Lobulomycetales sp.]
MQTRSIHILALTWARSTKNLYAKIKNSAILRNHAIYTDADYKVTNPPMEDCAQEIGRGTALIISPGLKPYIQNIFRIKGVYTEITLCKDKTKLLVAVVYKPHSRKDNQSNMEIEKIKRRIQTIRLHDDYKDHLAVFIGDWNDITDPTKDEEKAFSTPEERATNTYGDYNTQSPKNTRTSPKK